MQKVISVFVALATYLLVLLGVGEVESTNTFNSKKWMADLDGDLYISEISIPGTHDSCALYEPLPSVAKCQNYTIKDQLDMGVRFIDVRAWVIGGDTQTSHGAVLQKQTLDEVINTCLTFLDENPSETIIFSLKQENSSLFSSDEVTDVIKSKIEENEDAWYTENDIPTLDEVRGDIVLFNRYDKKSKLGLNAAGKEKWLENTSFTITNKNFKIHVQDHYNLGTADNIPTMWDEATSLMRDANIFADENNLFVNFLSGYVGLIPNIESVSDVMNANMLNHVSNAGKACYGIIIMDFVNAGLCEKIIETNF